MTGFSQLAARALLVLCGTLTAAVADAERKQQSGAYTAHYTLVPTLFLKPDIATAYGIARSRDRALLNVSVLDVDGRPVRARLTGSVRNLLEQQQALTLREVTEGEAVYYLAEVRHTDREVLRFAIDILPPDGPTQTLTFQQQMYWEGR
jgi:hypothetical protein